MPLTPVQPACSSSAALDGPHNHGGEVIGLISVPRTDSLNSAQFLRAMRLKSTGVSVISGYSSGISLIIH
jgi:hypothetical protein